MVPYQGNEFSTILKGIRKAPIFWFWLIAAPIGYVLCVALASYAIEYSGYIGPFSYVIWPFNFLVGVCCYVSFRRYKRFSGQRTGIALVVDVICCTSLIAVLFLMNRSIHMIADGYIAFTIMGFGILAWITQIDSHKPEKKARPRDSRSVRCRIRSGDVSRRFRRPSQARDRRSTKGFFAAEKLGRTDPQRS